MKELARIQVEGQHDVVLFRVRRRFRVKYGAEVSDSVRRTDAATVFGMCVMHALECAGKLDGMGEK